MSGISIFQQPIDNYFAAHPEKVETPAKAAEAQQAAQQEAKPPEVKVKRLWLPRASERLA